MYRQCLPKGKFSNWLDTSDFMYMCVYTYIMYIYVCFIYNAYYIKLY